MVVRNGVRDPERAERVRRHERRNVLHTLTGLLELAEAADFTAGVDEELVRAHLAGRLMAADARGVRLRLAVGSSLRRRPDEAWDLITVLGNLIDNAMDAVVGAGRDEPWVEVALVEHGAELEIRVTDNGPGVPPRLRRWIFADGASTKRRPDAGPRGLGLALIQEIVERRGGSATVTERPGGGAVFTVRLPAPAADRGPAVR